MHQGAAAVRQRHHAALMVGVGVQLLRHRLGERRLVIGDRDQTLVNRRAVDVEAQERIIFI